METCQSSDTLLHVIKRIKQIYNESDDLDVIQVLTKSTSQQGKKR